jgi:hypothetical protein
MQLAEGKVGLDAIPATVADKAIKRRRTEKARAAD